MAELIYSAITSLDGFVNDANGGFDWAAPDDELHSYINELERPIGTYLYGRRLYETMLYWETASSEGDSSPAADYAHIWRAADKIVYSTTLTAASSAKTVIEPEFDPAKLSALKAGADRNLSIGGPTLAAHAIRAGLVDELHLFVTPTAIGGGTRALPADLVWPLELVDEHRCGGGVVHLHYRLRR